MSIASEITRLQNAKDDIKTSIENKGVEVPSTTTLDGYSSLIDSIVAGGGDGLEYEEGTFNPTTNATYYNIYYKEQHSKAPVIVAVVESEGTPGASNFYGMFHIDIEKIFGTTFKERTGQDDRYGFNYMLFYSSSSILGTQTYYYRYSSDVEGYTSYHPYYYARPTFIHATGNSTYFRTGKTYKWIAIWKND